MLSIEECRRILGDDKLSDEEIEELRDDLYAWLNEVLDAYFKNPL